MFVWLISELRWNLFETSLDPGADADVSADLDVMICCNAAVTMATAANNDTTSYLFFSKTNGFICSNDKFVSVAQMCPVGRLK